MNRYFIFSLLCFLTINLTSQKQTTQEYIDKWKNTAIKQMQEHKIPASITLAQGILESGNGNSRLATKANNHFGIKCHSSWTGKKIYHDDDKKQECFRHYTSADESFEDHSLFLKKKRYQNLFKLKLTDYKGWAKGLKKAGYATNPKYPKLLISLVERYNLDEFDKNIQIILPNDTIIITDPAIVEDNKDIAEEDNELTGTIVIGNKHIIKNSNNRVQYIVARKGDTYKSLSKEFDMRPWQFYKYNDSKKGYTPKAGEIIYLKPKRCKAKSEFHIVKKGETMRGISQKHAIKLRKLYKKNRMIKGSQPKVGDKLSLRKRIKN